MIFSDDHRQIRNLHCTIHHFFSWIKIIAVEAKDIKRFFAYFKQCRVYVHYASETDTKVKVVWIIFFLGFFYKGKKYPESVEYKFFPSFRSVTLFHELFQFSFDRTIFSIQDNVAQ